jgi:hypothetical protein
MDTEFRKIGKESPYNVPDGFFEQVSELTLGKAKQRERNHKKIQMALRGFAVAASLTAIAFFSYFWSDSEKQVVRQFVQQEQHDTNVIIRQQEVIGKQIPACSTKEVPPDKANVRETEPEALSDVLPELTDDELLQMAAVYKTDPFIDESIN